jgi:hypothetical protein
MAFEVDIVKGNSNYNFILAGITGSNTGAVSGVIMNEVPMAFANDFATAREALDELLSSLPLGQTIGGAVSAFRGGADILRQLSAVSGRSKLTVAETRKVWNGSGTPEFTVDFFFYALSTAEAVRPMDKIKDLQRCILPSGSTEAGGKLFQKAPLGYKADGTGTMTLKIGNWFQASGLVMTSMNFVPSREVMQDGSPLFVSGTFTVVPYQAISYEEFMSYYLI